MLHHDWDISPRAAIALQRELAGLVRVEPLAGPFRTIAGTDCAFVGKDQIIAVAVLCDARTLAPICSYDVTMPLKFPYVPGLLSFREAPAVIEAIRRLPQMPDLLMCDGQGLAHPRGLGLASHVGLLLDIPTIGAAKSRLCGVHRTPGPRRGCHVRLMLDGRVIGSVVRTRANIQPMYISVGHRITLAEAIRWAIRCSTVARVPQPTRLAHMLVSQIKTTRSGDNRTQPSRPPRQ